MKKFFKGIAVTLLLLTAVNAIIAGVLFIIDPSGQLIGMSVEYLQFSPFNSFLIPGIILTSVNGLLNIFAAIYTLREQRHYPYWILLQGILLGGWIIVQMIMVRDINALHLIMLSIGASLCICAWGLRRS